MQFKTQSSVFFIKITLSFFWIAFWEGFRARLKELSKGIKESRNWRKYTCEGLFRVSTKYIALVGAGSCLLYTV